MNGPGNAAVPRCKLFHKSASCVVAKKTESSGLPLVFAFKTLIPLFALLMALQGVAQAIRSLAVLRAR